MKHTDASGEVPTSPHEVPTPLQRACRRDVDWGGEVIRVHSVTGLAAGEGVDVDRLPFSVRVLLENLVRHADRAEVGDDRVRAILRDPAGRAGQDTVALWPARILAQDVSGIPALIDLATMRDVLAGRGGDPGRIDPRIPVELVIDHSVIVDHAGSGDALERNVALEFRRNQERYRFLKWAQQAFRGLRVVPPGNGILHQINLERLARVVMIDRSGPMPMAWPDTVAGTDSHTVMTNGIGVLGWGVGGIEAEAAMLGEPLMFPMPETVGVRLAGRRPAGTTAADLVLRVTRQLREAGVVECFVEFTGPALDDEHLTVEDRATLANMAPEYGSTCAFFPVDEATLGYLRRTGRGAQDVARVEACCRAMGLFRERGAPEPVFSRTVEIDLGAIRPSAAGPRRPHQQIPIREIRQTFDQHLEAAGKPAPPARPEPAATTGPSVASTTTASAPAGAAGGHPPLPDGAVILAAITSCTHTANPAAIIEAGLLARNARARGLAVPPWVKTSLTPGSRVVADYLAGSGLGEDLDALGFQIVGYGCASCGGGSGPIAPWVQAAIDEGGARVSAVLSGNRNFEGRIHPSARANYLMSPAMVVAYALAGTIRRDLERDGVADDRDGRPVALADLWPDAAEVARIVTEQVRPDAFRARYADLAAGDAHWQALPDVPASRFAWDPASTYVRQPPFVDVAALPERVEIHGAAPLLVLGDGVTTDNISPADDIRPDTPAGRYLRQQGVAPDALHTYIARRGNHDVMVRAAFTGGRLPNELLPSGPPGATIAPDGGDVAGIHDVAMRMMAAGVPAVVVAGQEYGTGSSRDWAAKGTRLLGVRAVLAEGFERIHRSNLVNLGVLPLVFEDGQTRLTLGIGADTRFDIEVPADLPPRGRIPVRLRTPGRPERTITMQARLDTGREIAIWRRGGILPYLLDLGG